MNSLFARILTHDVLLVVALLCITIALNVLFNRSSGLARVAFGVLGYGVLIGVICIERLAINKLGLSFANLRTGLIYGVIATAVIVAVMGLVYLVTPSVFLDQRYNQDISKLTFSLLVTLPLYTVLIEELLFRSILPAVLSQTVSVHIAFVLSSLVFGLWHILPSLSMKAVSIFGGALLIPRVAVIGSSIVAPFVAGLVLSWLAFRSKSLVAPIMAHWAINASGMIFAWLAWNR